ncbi:MAG: M1 family metallopeptidase [Flavobacteriales bacterium]
MAEVGQGAVSLIVNMKHVFWILSCFLSLFVDAQCYWQQSVAYEMEIDFDHTKHRFNGAQKLTYTNNSPDTLNRVFYHLYFNAFQPGSAMDVRSRTIADPDERIKDRIVALKPDEIGYHHIKSLRQDGKKVTHKVEGTVLVVELAKPILPLESTVFEMEFESQVPVQIRRSGRNNSEGVDYTMTQWYPKMAEYDRDGWHSDAYIAREFHGVFGSFDVKIKIDPTYVIGGTGVLQATETNSDKKQWHFKANNVHDFAWAADPKFVRKQAKTARGTELNFYHLDDEKLHANWNQMIPKAVEMFDIMDATFGEYPYPQFSVMQAGDGGMEYPMCTMISGTGSLGGLTSVTVHEAIHNWYYGVLATNELKYPWMDEGFTTYAQNFVLDSIYRRGSVNPQIRSVASYVNYVKNADEEPLTTHADHYELNSGYGNAAYSKGCVFLNQLQYIIGDQAFFSGMKQYFNQWKFKHPTPTDLKGVMESVSGLELDWYFEAWIGTTKQVDYAIRQVIFDGKSTKVLIERVGGIALPLEVLVRTEKEEVLYYIPLESMRGEKHFDKDQKIVVKPDWVWTYHYYELTIDQKFDQVKSIMIDPLVMTADVDRRQNSYPWDKEGTVIQSN